MLHLCRGRHRLDGVVDDRRQIDGLNGETHFSGNDARHVQHVFDHLRERGRVPFDDLDSLRDLIARHRTAAQQARVAEDRVQRRAQLMRQRREKFVFQSIAGLDMVVDEGIVDGECRPMRQISGEHQILLRVLAPRFSGRKRQRAQRSAVRHERHAHVRHQSQGADESQLLLVASCGGDEDLVRHRRYECRRLRTDYVRRAVGRCWIFVALQAAGLFDLQWIEVRHGEALDLCVDHDIDGAPIGYRWDRQIGEGGQRRLIVERSRQNGARLIHERGAFRRAFAIGDVAIRLEDHATAIGPDQLLMAFDDDFTTVAYAVAQFAGPLTMLDELFVEFLERDRMDRPEEIMWIPAEGLVARITIEPFAPGVPLHDAAVDIPGEDRIL